MKILAFLFMLGWSMTATAQIEATRYIDAQGIEVIHNRNAGAGSQVAKTTEDARVKVGPLVTPVIPSKVRQVASTSAQDPRMQISAGEQASRDRDRVAILQEELTLEAGKYADAFKRSQDKPEGRKLSAAEIQRINEELYEHQRNIQSLHAELRRARPAH